MRWSPRRRPTSRRRYARVYAAYAAHQNKPRYADKTPKYVKDMARLTNLFPEARFVHIVRDGRDVVLSFQSLTWGPDAAIEAALRWRNWVELGRAAARDSGEDKYMEVRYEELAADAPADSAGRLRVPVARVLGSDAPLHRARRSDHRGELLPGRPLPYPDASDEGPSRLAHRDDRERTS